MIGYGSSTKRLGLTFLTALALRAGMAALTERKPIFPPYYYMDAQLMDDTAIDMLGAWRNHREYSTSLSPSNRAYGAYAAFVYLSVGHHPIAVKLVNAVLGALACAFLGLAVAPGFGEAIGLTMAWLAACWPSHVFFTSQNTKDAVTFALAWGAFACAAPALAGTDASMLGMTGLFSALVLLGFFRTYLLMIVTCAVALAALLARRRRAALAALAAVPSYLLLSHILFTGPLRTPTRWDYDPTSHESLVVETYDPAQGTPATLESQLAGSKRYVRPFSPYGITRTRALRQKSESDWARLHGHGAIGTMLFEGLELKTWWDVAVFLPKGAFYVLFMPLPGLYPGDGRLGRLLASIENVPILVLGLLSFWALSRRRPNAGQTALLLFFLAMMAGSALLEFDLGSATRHKIAYLPALFPFGLAWFLDERRKR